MAPTAKVVSRGSAGIVLLLLVILFAETVCFATEAGLGAYWPGYRNYLAGIVPSKPGFSLRNDVVFFSGTADRVVLNGLPIENVSADVVVEIIEPIYVFPWKVFGGNHAFVVTQPFAWAKLSGRVIGTNIEPSGSRGAPGDTVVSPFYIGWHKGNIFFNTNLAIFIPTGDYDINRVVNISRNYLTFDPELGVTYLNPKTGLDVSGVLGYSINTENGATHYTSGDAIHLDFAVGQLMKNRLKPGISGYAWVQVTPDSGPGAIFGSFESRVFGIGPIVQWSVGRNSDLKFRYYHEFGATNHLQGDQYVLSFKAAL